MDLFTASCLICAGGTAGAVLGRAAGPLAWKWRDGPILVARLAQLNRAPPSRLRRKLGAGLLVGVLCAGALAAYAAEPSAPDRLPSQVIGVTGSGDQLSLQIKTPAGSATLKPGDAYADGWRLKSLTNTEAVLENGGETRRVGLNPTGAIAPALSTDAPSTVQIAGLPDAATIERLYKQELARTGDPDKPMDGLTRDETMRNVAYNEMINDAIMARRAAAAQRLGLPQDNIQVLTAAGVNKADMQAILGDAAYADQQALLDKWAKASGIDFSKPLGPGVP